MTRGHNTYVVERAVMVEYHNSFIRHPEWLPFLGLPDASSAFKLYGALVEHFPNEQFRIILDVGEIQTVVFE